MSSFPAALFASIPSGLPVEACFPPGVVAHQSQAEKKNDGGGGPDGFQRVAAAREMRFLAAVAKFPHGESQAELREDENRGRDSESQIILMIDLGAHGGDRRRPDCPGKIRGENVNGDGHHYYDN